MSQVPEARAILEALALSMDELIESLQTLQSRIQLVIPMLIREPYIRKAPQKNRLTLEAANRIRKYFKENPNASLQEIASATGVNNMGRVSEVIHGKRFPKTGK